MSNDYNIKVLNKETTLQILLEDHNSLIRFGDGELDLIRGASIPYQDYQPELAGSLKELLLEGSNRRLLVGLSDVFEKLDRYNDYCRNFYQNSFFPNNHNLLREVELQYNVYVSTFFSRPYIDLVDKSHAKDYFAKMKQLWQDRDLLIVEGKYSRSGEGNDLFSNAKSISRLICPPTNAYSRKKVIEDEIIKNAANRLILLMLGPTAKVIVADLIAQLNNQMIDIGHIDSEYEWMKMGVTNKVKIPHKHTAEFNFDDKQVKLEKDDNFDKQIISIIE
ncbi:SP_1767 family glycosyltransferase [Lactobacillus crispatus]|jgi:glycosyltransferase family protein|uniref:SP_1767 family glycosyltransferase n=1 Tax=Lactobacillus crispatus TaxID=47770 RepID=UPI0018AB9A0B|nr:SP_1767 family glycosyltransferase [Lactobacillus crispatus]MCH4003997.1 SP_1767 family glycosyltransferase [Lactobacillus crispatus]MCI1365030.1 SP_1767 family glycosyltransferase [Lactobacillus crispatus]MCI1525078.1 SP_1767 family glycosyltransferase [Lactobacillus crispatus]